MTESEQTFFSDGMAIPELVRAVRDTPLLSQEEAGQAEALEKDMESRGLSRPVALEAWLLKVAMTGQYAAGVLERFGVPAAGLRQFYQMYRNDQEERFRLLFGGQAEKGKHQVALRFEAYDQALHAPPSGDPGNDVAALFCRFLGADREAGLVDFCHDLCSELNQVFSRELDRLAGEAGGDS
jgi:hypothetical protein